MSLPFRSRPSRTKALDKILSSLTLLGGKVPQAQSLTILELGCGYGDALLHNAKRFPQHTFIGVDKSKDCLKEAQEVAENYSIQNIKLIESALSEFTLKDKKADIIICHGLYSWSDESTRKDIRSIISRDLSADGCVVISAAIEPGFVVRKIISDWIKRSKLPNPRKALNDLVQSVPFEFERPFGLLLHRELTRLSQESDAYIEAEFLTELKSYHIEDLVSEIASAGLSYIGDVRLQRSPISEDGDSLAAERKYDFINGTSFRESIFSRSTKSTLQEIPLDWWISPSLESLQVEDELHPIQEHLRKVWPKAVRVKEIKEKFPDDTSTLKEIIYSERAELSPVDLPVADAVPEWPFIPVLFKTHRPLEWSNARYDPVELGAFEDALALMCDGRRSKAELAKEVKVMMGDEAPDEATIDIAVEEGLITILTAGLILEP